MRSDYSHISLVVDRSGSMSNIASDMNGAIETFLKDQAKEPGKCTVSLHQFDSEYETVYEMLDVNDVPAYNLHPRNSTALLDAIGKTINSLGQQLAKMNESDRPSKVFFVIVTDGHENASREFKRKDIKYLIDRQQNQYNWQFVMMGGEVDLSEESFNLNVKDGSKFVFDKTSHGVMSGYACLSQNVSRARSLSADAYGELVSKGEFFNDNKEV